MELSLASTSELDCALRVSDVNALDPGIVLRDPARSGGTFTASVFTGANEIYYFEYKDTASQPTWTPLYSFAGNGGSVLLKDTSASGSKRFYQVHR